MVLDSIFSFGVSRIVISFPKRILWLNEWLTESMPNRFGYCKITSQRLWCAHEWAWLPQSGVWMGTPWTNNLGILPGHLAEGWCSRTQFLKCHIRWTWNSITQISLQDRTCCQGMGNITTDRLHLFASSESTSAEKSLLVLPWANHLVAGQSVYKGPSSCLTLTTHACRRAAEQTGPGFVSSALLFDFSLHPTLLHHFS